MGPLHIVDAKFDQTRFHIITATHQENPERCQCKQRKINNTED